MHIWYDHWYYRYFEDVKMQAMCGELGTKFNQHGCPKPVQFLPAWVLEMSRSPNAVYCGLEPYIGTYRIWPTSISISYHPSHPSLHHSGAPSVICTYLPPSIPSPYRGRVSEVEQQLRSSSVGPEHSPGFLSFQLGKHQPHLSRHRSSRYVLIGHLLVIS